MVFETIDRFARIGRRGMVAAVVATAGCATEPLTGVVVDPPASEPVPQVAVVPPLPQSFAVSALALSSEGDYLATGSNDTTLVIWDLRAWQPVQRFAGHDWAITAVAFHPRGQKVASTSAGQVNVWDLDGGPAIRARMLGPGRTPVSTGNELFVTSVVFSGNGDSLFIGTYSGLYEISPTPVPGMQPFRRILTVDRVDALAITPDGRHLIAGIAGELCIWELSGNAPPRRFKAYANSRVTSVASSQTSRFVAAGSEAGELSIWSLSGDPVARFAGHAKTVRTLAFSPGDKLLVSGSEDMVAHVWNADTFAKLSSEPFSRAVSGVAFLPGTERAVAGGGGFLSTWEGRTGANARHYGSRLAAIPTTLSVSPDGIHVMSGIAGGSYVIWNLRTGRMVRRFKATADKPWAKATAFGRLGQLAAYNYEGLVDVWDFRTGEKLYSLKLRGTEVVRFSPDGTTLLTGSDDGLRMWNAKDGKLIRDLGPWISLFGDGIEAAAYSASGKRMASSQLDSANRTIVRDLETGQTYPLGDVITTQAQAATEAFFGLERRSASTLDINADGTRVLTGARNGVMRLWDVETGVQLRRFVHADPIAAVALSANQKHALSVSGSVLRLWDLQVEVRELWKVGGRELPIVSASFISEGRQILGICDDGTWRIWDATSGELLLTYSLLSDRGDWLAYTPHGLFDGTPSAWGSLRWRFSARTLDTLPLESFYEDYFRPGLLDAVVGGRAELPRRDIGQVDRVPPLVAIEKVEQLDAVPGNRPLARLHIVVGRRAVQHGRPAGIRDLRVFRNGVRVHFQKGELIDPSNPDIQLKDLTVTVPLVAGNNRLMVNAFNSDGVKSLDYWTDFKPSTPFSRPARAYVVAVGADRYQFGWPELTHARADADRFVRSLQKHLRESGRYGEVIPIPLLGEGATLANIEATLLRLAGRPVRSRAAVPQFPRAEPEDLVVVFFAGHGTARDDRFYFHPFDAATSGSMMGSLSDTRLEQLLEDIQAGEFAIIFDSCHSGQALGPEDLRIGARNARGLAQLAWEKGMTILAASQSYQSARESTQLGHGLLTHALVAEGLEAGKADIDPENGQVTVHEWLEYARQRVPALHADLIANRLRIGQEANRLLGAQSGDGKMPPQLLDAENQNPRFFYRTEPASDPLVLRIKRP